jgi:hypothetical protein
MKKQTFSNAIRRTILFFGMSSFVLFSFMPIVSHAQDKPATPEIVIKYIGNVEEQPVFQIEFENATQQALNLTIRDEDGNFLYGEKVKDKKYQKKFKYQGPLFDNVKLTFTLAGEKDRQVQVYELNTRTRMIQDVVVTRL